MLRWAIGLCLAVTAAAQEDLQVIQADHSPAAAEMVRAYLLGHVDESLLQRRAALEEMQTAEAIQAHQDRMRAFFLEQIGGPAPVTPLNAQIVGGETREQFRYEKIIFESFPNHRVTATLYLPLTPGPHPVMLIPCGHDANGKAAEAYQRVALFLNRSGIAAFCYDPIGQGERYQILDESGKPRFGSTVEHIHVGVGSILAGRGTASYRIWDGMRAIDYLTSRADIDAKRIGCAGHSGGGTLTTYLMALDDRVAVAAPNCYITSPERHLHIQGPHDAEQNIFGSIKEGMTYADYIIMRAPKPTLITCATKDFFDIEGTWDTYRQAKRVYSYLGYPERMDINEWNDGHGWHEPLRTSTVRFMRRWLIDQIEPVWEEPVTLLTDAELQCTPEGQVMLAPGEQSVVDINAAYEVELAAKRDEQWAEWDTAKRAKEVRRVAAIRELTELPEPTYEKRDTIQRDGYSIEKGIIQSEPGIYLPCLTFRPAAATTKAVLYAHGNGKAADASPGGPIEALVRAGHVVVGPDLRGLGETKGTCALASGYGDWFGSEWQDIYLAYLLGRSYVGMRAEDILQCARVLPAILGSAPTEVHLHAIGEAGIPGLHAAALAEPGFASVTESGVVDWQETVRTAVTQGQFVNAVHGALAVYDLGKLRGMAAQK
ncbi:MAG: hypothetical protein AMXMBFR84_20080 [Candidatus Hydrogenedentota bacterium]